MLKRNSSHKSTLTIRLDSKLKEEFDLYCLNRNFTCSKFLRDFIERCVAETSIQPIETNVYVAEAYLVEANVSTCDAVVKMNDKLETCSRAFDKR